jgi:hypothetical protein
MVELEKPRFVVAAFLASAGLGKRIIQLAPKEARQESSRSDGWRFERRLVCVCECVGYRSGYVTGSL